jgi:hypothetical protein
MKPLKVAFDIGGVLSKYPDVMHRLVESLLSSGQDVHVITDMHIREEVLDVLRKNGFGSIPAENVHTADYQTHGEGCKAELLRELGIDIFLDDFVGYVAIPSSTIRLLVMPDPYQPYYAPEWVCNAGPDFGRRTYTR